jgi:hypothetical protein
MTLHLYNRLLEQNRPYLVSVDWGVVGCRMHGVDCSTIYSKGAAEIMLPLCDRVAQDDGSVATLSEEQGQQILEGIQKGGERFSHHPP